MNKNDINFVSKETRLFDLALRNFNEYANSFLTIAGLDINLIHSEDAGWKSVSSRIRSSWCKSIAGGTASHPQCGQAFSQQLVAADRSPIGKFVSCECPARFRFSITRLEKSGDVQVYLLVGRVPVTTDGADCVKGTVSEAQYAAALRMLERSFPLFRSMVGDLTSSEVAGHSASVRRTYEYMKAHFREDIHLGDIASACGVSEDWLSHHFRKESGLRLRQFLSQFRIEHADKLLKDSSLSVTDVCFESGFQSLSQFNRTFLRWHGVSPRAYRRGSSI